VEKSLGYFPLLLKMRDRTLHYVRDLRQPEQRGRIAIEPAARWLAALAA